MEAFNMSWRGTGHVNNYCHVTNLTDRMHRVSWTWSKQSSSGCSPPSVLKPPALLTSAENWSGVQLCHSQIFSEAQLLSWVLASLQANPQPSLFQEFLNSSECSHHPQHHFVLSQLESTITFRCTLLLGDRRANSETKHHGFATLWALSLILHTRCPAGKEHTVANADYYHEK